MRRGSAAIVPAARPVSLIRLSHLTDKSKSSELFAYARFGNQMSQANQVKRPQNEERKTMAKIKTTKQFKDGIDAAFETQKTRDEAKAWRKTG